MTAKHIVTDKNKDIVAGMARVGIPQEGIARVLEIDKKTLLKYYRDELDKSSTVANAAVAGRLYEKAMEGDTTAMIWWTKTRMRWSEKTTIDHQGGEDMALNVAKIVSGLSDKDIETHLERINGVQEGDDGN